MLPVFIYPHEGRKASHNNLSSEPRDPHFLVRATTIYCPSHIILISSFEPRNHIPSIISYFSSFLICSISLSPLSFIFPFNLSLFILFLPHTSVPILYSYISLIFLCLSYSLLTPRFLFSTRSFLWYFTVYPIPSLQISSYFLLVHFFNISLSILFLPYTLVPILYSYFSLIFLCLSYSFPTPWFLFSTLTFL